MLSTQNDTNFVNVDRRQFLAGTAATLVIPVTLSLTTQGAEAATTGVGAYIKIDTTSNNVTLITGQTEMGQGIGTGLAQIIAEELMLNWSQVQFEHAPIDPATYGLNFNGYRIQLTGGSTSTMIWYQPLREAAAKAAYRLRAAAALTYGGNIADWSLVLGGQVTHSTHGTHPFKDVLGKIGETSDPGSATPVGTKRIIGQSVRRLDIADKVNGKAIFGMDKMLPNMVFASVLHCPKITGTVKSCPTTASGALKVVNLGDAVGVVAVNTYAAMKAANSIASKVIWNNPTDLPKLDSASMTLAAQTLQSTASPANLQIEETIGSAPSVGTLDATYITPFLAHACMEVMNCTVSITTSGATPVVEIWAPTQGQSFVTDAVHSVSGLSTATVKLNSMLCGGGFGRKIEQDYVIQAVKLAKVMGKPVKLTWSRPQDFKNDKYRPYASMRVQAGANSGGITDLLYRNVSTSISNQRQGTPEDTGAVAGAVNLPYAITNRRVEFVVLPTKVPLGYWRSVGESYNTFAVESAIDEIALKLGADPIDYRLNMLGADQRATDVLTALKNSSSYTGMNSSKRGVAFLKGFNSYVALAVEIGLDSLSQVKVTKAHYVIDVGVMINPNSIEAQMQGGLVHGIYSALYNRVTFANGVPSAQNFSNYRVLRLSQMPTVTVDIIEGDPTTQYPGGVGETGVPCVAPAIANAYHRMSGTRIRELPFYPNSTMSE